MTKVIKITAHYRKIGKWDYNFRKVPKITISGDWLAAAGFKPSKMVRVECVNNTLVVTSIE
ncbi:MAG TPA: SymE family type I addiction module toxin [Bacteroidales bacterium]|nr:SymE family type I addiction module toxin [Bacteroidales bacterium]